MKRVLLAAAAALVLSACGVQTEAGSEVKSQFPEGVIAADVTLYDTWDYEPNGFCDRFVTLELRNYGHRNVASLENGLAGTCEIFVEPNPRSYDLKVGTAGCGSKKYTSKETDANGQPLLIVIDHRSRQCEDLQPNKIVVKELVDGVYYTLYSPHNR